MITQQTSRKKCGVCIALCVLTSSYANDFTSHTTFVTRPQFHDVSPEKIALFHQTPLERTDGLGTGFQCVAFGSMSVNTAKMARYFLPFGKTQIVAGELKSDAVADNTVDVLAHYFGVRTSNTEDNQKFQSTIQFKPKQTVTGLGFNYVQDFPEWKSRAFRFMISTPLLRVHNDLQAKETITNHGGDNNNPEVPEGYVGSMMDALTGQTVFGDKHFCYGKIAQCGLTKWGLGDIEVTLGTHDRQLGTCQRGWWAGVVIPTGNKPNGEYLFEPIVGNNKHFGVLWGGYYHHRMWTNNNDKEIWVNFHSQTRHLFGNKQRRSIDFIDKQWGRYTWLYQDDTVAPTNITPGINIMTFPVKVSPRSVLNLNTGITYSCEGLLLEGGMNTFARQSEKISLRCAYEGDAAIVGNEPYTEDPVPTTAKSRSNSTIRRFKGIDNDTDSVGQQKYVPFKEADLNLASATQPATLAYIFYASAGYQWLEVEFPTFVAIGGSYEYSADNAGLERYIIWLKGGMAF